MAKQSKKNQPLDRSYIWIPVVAVNFCFATELLLKSTIYFDSGSKSWGHNLLKLYEKISKEAKTKIESYYGEFIVKNRKDKILPS